MIDLISADVLEWAANYTGPKFHALLCDPPYHLHDGNPNAKGGFMGKAFDGGDIAFDPATWAALAEHLHPGGFIMAFASSRGWHRLAVALEDAGLRIHPSIFGWAFGCLSDDTEILTDKGWKLGVECSAGDMAMCYNMESSAFDFMPVAETFKYDYDEPAYAIRSDRTDQLVSRNHRVIVERNGRPVFELAERLQAQETVYVARPEEGYDELQVGRGKTQDRPDHRLPDLRSRGLQNGGVASQGQGSADVRERMPGASPVTGRSLVRATAEHCIARAFGLDSREPGKRQRKDERAEQSRVEGWRYLLSQAWQLSAGKVCSLPFRVLSNGSQGWLRNGASAVCGASVGEAALTLRGGPPRRPRSAEQRSSESGTVRLEQGSQAVRTSWGARPDLATVTPVHYRGVVWCVRVPTGAFVARRNGKAFVTGNSGFPKATRIDTQIDKAAGAERVDLGPNPNKIGHTCDMRGGRLVGNGTANMELVCRSTAPATPLAAVWEGHRYGRQALKPALEPIVVAQKPYAGRPVDSIVATGAGALWVDGGRVATGETWVRNGAGLNGPYTSDRTWNTSVTPGADLGSHPAGRWPPNFCLSHLPPTPCPCAAYTPDGAPVAGCRECGGTGTRPGCVRVGMRRVKNPSGQASGPTARKMGTQGIYNGANGDGKASPFYADADGLELVADWRCVEPCPVRRLGEQSGELASGARNGAWGDTSHNGYGSIQLGGACEASSGNAARFFPNHDYALDIAERIAAADPVAYVAKASRRERNAGLDGWPERMPDNAVDRASQQEGREGAAGRGSHSKPRANLHPTVKPLALARWLATLLLPPDAYAPRRILIPFAGSGSECIGAMLAGWEDVVGVEREAEYVAIAEARLAWWAANRDKAPEVRAMGDQPELAKQPNGRPAKGETAAYGRFVGNHRTNGHAAPAPMLPGMEATI